MADALNNIKKLLAAILAPVQDLESAFQQLLIDRSIDTAVFAQLDAIGKIVGQERNGQVDDDYRRYIRARISANRSKGPVADVLKAADLIVYDDAAYYHAIQYGIAGLHLVVEDIIIDDYELIRALILLMRDTVAGGVRIVVETWPLAEADLFVFDDILGGVGVGKGWGDILTPADGGGLASAGA